MESREQRRGILQRTLKEEEEEEYTDKCKDHHNENESIKELHSGWEEPAEEARCTDSRAVECPFCGKVLKYRCNLKSHIQNQHEESEPGAPCPICPEKVFKNAASLRDHLRRPGTSPRARNGRPRQPQSRPREGRPGPGSGHQAGRLHSGAGLH